MEDAGGEVVGQRVQQRGVAGRGREVDHALRGDRDLPAGRAGALHQRQRALAGAAWRARRRTRRSAPPTRDPPGSVSAAAAASAKNSVVIARASSGRSSTHVRSKHDRARAHRGRQASPRPASPSGVRTVRQVSPATTRRRRMPPVQVAADLRRWRASRGARAAASRTSSSSPARCADQLDAARRSSPAAPRRSSNGRFAGHSPAARSAGGDRARGGPAAGRRSSGRCPRPRRSAPPAGSRPRRCRRLHSGFHRSDAGSRGSKTTNGRPTSRAAARRSRSRPTIALRVGDQHRDPVAEDPRQQPAARADRLARAGRADDQQVLALAARDPPARRRRSSARTAPRRPAALADQLALPDDPRPLAPRARSRRRAARARATERRHSAVSASELELAQLAARAQRRQPVAPRHRPPPTIAAASSRRRPRQQLDAARCASAQQPHASARAARARTGSTPTAACADAPTTPQRRPAPATRDERSRQRPHQHNAHRRTPRSVNRTRSPSPGLADRAGSRVRIAGASASVGAARPLGRSDGGPPPARRRAPGSESAAPAARRARPPGAPRRARPARSET